MIEIPAVSDNQNAVAETSLNESDTSSQTRITYRNQLEGTSSSFS